MKGLCGGPTNDILKGLWGPQLYFPSSISDCVGLFLSVRSFLIHKENVSFFSACFSPLFFLFLFFF